MNSIEELEYRLMLLKAEQVDLEDQINTLKKTKKKAADDIQHTEILEKRKNILITNIATIDNIPTDYVYMVTQPVTPTVIPIFCEELEAQNYTNNNKPFCYHCRVNKFLADIPHLAGQCPIRYTIVKIDKQELLNLTNLIQLF